MAKEITKPSKRDIRRAANIADTAEIVGVSTRTVQRVLNAEQKNENVLSVFMVLSEEHNKLLKAVKELVPFN
jgi:DNA-binding LacI/PurR family transcriptional regulator